jgi:hypothetical protein
MEISACGRLHPYLHQGTHCAMTSCSFLQEVNLEVTRMVPEVRHNTYTDLLTYKKTKCTLVQALWLCTGRTAHRGSKGIVLLFHDHGTRRGWGISVTPRPLFTPGKDPVPIVQKAGWTLGPVWTSAENLAPTGIQTPDRPARSQSLYQICYPVHDLLILVQKILGVRGAGILHHLRSRNSFRPTDI